MKLYTIGTSKITAEEFFNALVKAGIELLVDIRLNNKSQLLGFSKGKDLEYFCNKCFKMKYQHVPLFAPTKEILNDYQNSKDWDLYEKRFHKLLNSRPIIDKYKQISANANNICLLCSESKPEKCHRRLVAEYISSGISDITIIHL
jgi:uncharacterized protein (DUF488 family)